MATVYQKNLTTLQHQADARAYTAAVRKLAGLVAPVQPGRTGAPPTLTRRWGVIAGVNADSTVSLNLDGQILADAITGVPIEVAYLNSYSPQVADTVIVDFLGADPLVIGSPASAAATPLSVVTADAGAAVSAFTAATTMCTVALITQPYPRELSITGWCLLQANTAAVIGELSMTDNASIGVDSFGRADLTAAGVVETITLTSYAILPAATACTITTQADRNSGTGTLTSFSDGRFNGLVVLERPAAI